MDVSAFYQMGLSAGNRLGGLTKNLNTGDKYIPDMLQIQNQQQMQMEQLGAQRGMQREQLKEQRKTSAMEQSQANRRQKAEIKSKEREGAKDRESQQKIADKSAERAITAAIISGSKKGVNDPWTVAQKAAQGLAPAAEGISRFFGGKQPPTAGAIGEQLQNVLGSISGAVGGMGGMGGGLDPNVKAEMDRVVFSNPTLTKAFVTLKQFRAQFGTVIDENNFSQALGPDHNAVIQELLKINPDMDLADILAYMNS